MDRFLHNFRFFFAAACVLFSFPAYATSPEKLATELGARVSRVPEFEFIRAEAEKLGVKVYLFGGTAASYAHYVREDLLREGGDARFPEHRFDYDYTNIFRSTQDLDVVVDGPVEKANKLQALLKEKFPHFIGDKGADWEVRPLREASGAKEAILGNPNFLNQHTDSHSTGMVELTKPKTGESVVRDVRDWESKKPQFLKDVNEAKLHYYYNPLHGSTKRAAEGLNPPIVSVIRYLTKAFQYGLEMRPEDLAKVKQIVAEFKPGDINNDYLRRWVEKNGKKLFQHATDLEYAWDTIQNLGLREKLAAIKGNPAELESLAWWMNKEPLRTHPVGEGSGKTASEIAKELGLEKLDLAHETNSFLAYESISRDRGGELNALVSREGKVGEAAVHGEGFYTKIGRAGARGTGFTLRMELDPKAREKTDFTRAGDFIVLHNKAAVRVKAEAIQLSLPEFFSQLAASEKGWNPDDKALLHSFLRRVGRTSKVSKEDLAAVLKIVQEDLAKPKLNLSLAAEWLALPASVEHPELAEQLIAKVFSLEKNRLAINKNLVPVFASAHWQNNPALLDAVVKSGNSYVHLLFLEEIFKNPSLANNEVAIKFLDGLISGKTNFSHVISAALFNPAWQGTKARPELWRRFIASNHSLTDAIIHLGAKPVTDFSKQALIDIAATGRGDSELFRLLDYDNWKNTNLIPDLMDGLVKRGNADPQLAEYLLSKEPWIDSPKFPEWIRLMLSRPGNTTLDYKIANWIVPKIKDQTLMAEVVDKLFARGLSAPALVRAIGTPPLVHHPRAEEWLRLAVKQNKDSLGILLTYPFNNYDRVEGYPNKNWVNDRFANEMIDLAVTRPDLDETVAMFFGKPKWIKHPKAAQWIRPIIERNQADKMLFAHNVFLNGEWEYHPEFFRQIVEADNDPAILRSIWQRRAAGPVTRSVSGNTITININCSVNFGRLR